jgi:hypothetical protein
MRAFTSWSRLIEKPLSKCVVLGSVLVVDPPEVRDHFIQFLKDSRDISKVHQTVTALSLHLAYAGKTTRVTARADPLCQPRGRAVPRLSGFPARQCLRMRLFAEASRTLAGIKARKRLTGPITNG